MKIEWDLLKTVLTVVGIWLGSSVIIAIAGLVYGVETQRDIRIFMVIATISATLTLLLEPVLLKIPQKHHFKVIVLLTASILLIPVVLWLISGRNLPFIDVCKYWIRALISSIILLPTLPVLMIVPTSIILIGIILYVTLRYPSEKGDK